MTTTLPSGVVASDHSGSQMDSFPPVPAYGLACPAESEIKAKLARALGAEESKAAWHKACSAAGYLRNERFTPDELMAIGKHLSSQEGVAGIYGTVLLVRVNSYLLLSQRTVTASHEK